MKMKDLLKAVVLTAAVALSGCEADGNASDLPGGGNNGPNPGGIADITNCQVPAVGIPLCLLGGPDHSGGLVDALLDPAGPLGPIAGAINIGALTTELGNILANDNNLASLVQGLIVDGQLADGLRELLLGGGLQNSLTGLLLGNEEGNGLRALFGEEGLAGLVQALLLDGTGSNCQAPLGTLCLIAGEDSNQLGLVDLLLTSNGVLAALSPHLTAETTDDVVALLGDLLASNGALPNLLQNLLMEGQLAEGLQLLLAGDPDQGVPSGLVQAVQSLLGGLGDVVTDILTRLGGIFGLGGGLSLP